MCFSVIYFNCRSLLPKLDELRAICATHCPDVVCLVETYTGCVVILWASKSWNAEWNGIWNGIWNDKFSNKKRAADGAL